MLGKPHEECGLFGIYNQDDLDVAEKTYLALYALQHRGQASAGIAVNQNGKISFHKDVGMVPEVFHESDLEELGQGQMAVGHVRDASNDKRDRVSAQPLSMRYVKGPLVIAHNGALSNFSKVREELEEGGAIFQTTTDAEMIAYTIARQRLNTGTIEQAVELAMDKLEGAYSLIIMTPGKLVGARDPQGFRPLALGKCGNSYMLASESCAFDSIGGEFIRDVEPGEIIVINKEGLKSVKAKCGRKSSLCIFEYVYFSRPDSSVDGVSVNIARQEAGKILAREHPVEADMVCGVPDSGLDAALGFSQVSGIPFGYGLLKNKYTGRAFVYGKRELVENSVRVKMTALKESVRGKRLVLIDDSIVSGGTSAYIVKILREAGAREVHMRVSSPPFLYPCYFGTDISSKNNLIAREMDLEQIRRHLDVDSLGYLSIEGVRSIAGNSRLGICDACFSGNYPIPVSEEHREDKFSKKLEK